MRFCLTLLFVTVALLTFAAVAAACGVDGGNGGSPCEHWPGGC